MSDLLEVVGLRVVCRGASGAVLANDDIDLVVGRGEIVGIIGESGSGKTTLVRAIIGLLSRNCAAVAGSIRFRGETVFAEGVDRLRVLRGRHIGMIFQNPVGSLNPVLRVGTQIREVLRTHTDRDDVNQVAAELLQQLGFDDPARVLSAYPHQLSGGMCQRIAIAIAVASEPEIVIADECTSALDVTTQAEVIQLLRKVTGSEGWTLLFVTHDILLATELCSRLVVMYGGHVVEEGPMDEVVGAPRHPYTDALLAAVPLWQPRTDLRGIPGTPTRIRPGFVGCRFSDRCPRVQPACTEVDIPWTTEPERRYRCLFPIEDSRQTSGAVTA